METIALNPLGIEAPGMGSSSATRGMVR